MSDKRIGWDEYFINLLDKLGDRVTCTRGKCAAIFTIDNRIVATGYAGAPPNLPHCTEIGDQLEERVQFLENNLYPFNGSIEYSLNGLIYKWNVENNRYQTEKKISCIRTSHAESNGIYTAAKYGISLNNSTLYVSMTCCRNCAMAVISVGTKRVVCEKKYHAGQETEYMFRKAGIELVFMSDEIVKYSNQTVT